MILNKLLFLLFIIFNAQKIGSQPVIEQLLPISSVDTSTLGQDLLWDETNDVYYILSNVQVFDTTLTSGILIDGPLTYGSKISRLNSTGVLEWDKLYYTNCYNDCFGGLQLYGREPGKKILLQNTNKLILPFSHFGGIRICEDGAGAFSFYTRMISINTINGDIIEDNDTFFEDFGCKNEIILDIIKQGDNIRILAEDKINDKMLFTRHNESLEMIDSLAFSNNRQPRFIDENTGDLISVWNEYALFFDGEGNLTDSIHYGLLEAVYSSKNKFFENENFLGFLIQGKQISDDSFITAIIVFNRELQLISQEIFPNRRIIDAQFIEDQIIFLEDKSNGFFDDLEKPIRVGLFNSSLQESTFTDYGFPYVVGEKLKVFDNQYFGVVGTSLRSFIELENGRQADRTYVLVDNISSLNVNRNINYPHREPPQIYPNPFSSQVWIEVENFQGEVWHLSVWNESGQIFYSFDVKHQISSINSSNWPSGLYFIEGKDKQGKRIFIKKIVKGK